MESNKKDWYDQEEYEKLVASIQRELKANPDPSLGEEDINLFAKRHLLRRLVSGVIHKVKEDSPEGPYFLLNRFTAEWKRSYKKTKVDFTELGYSGLCSFFNSFWWLLNNVGAGKFVIKGNFDFAEYSSSSSPKKIIAEEKEASWMLNESRSMLRVEDEGALRQKVIAVANRVSKYDEAHKHHFLLDDFLTEWRISYGDKHVRCTQFGYKYEVDFFEAIPTFRRISRRKFAIRSTESNSGVEDSSSDYEKRPAALRKTVECDRKAPGDLLAKTKPVKRSRSPDDIVLEADKPSRKVPKQEIQEEKVTRLVGEEELEERETVRGGTRDGETTMGCGGETQLMGFEQKEHAPVNQAVMNPSAVAPALGLLMPEGPPPPQPFFARPSMYLPSKGEAAGRYMTYLLDQAEREGHNVDEIAMEAINLINHKITKKK